MCHKLLNKSPYSHKQLVVSIPRLSSPSCHLPTGQNKHVRNILINVTSVIFIMVAHFDCIHSCLVEKSVPIVFILPSRWQDGTESLGI